MAGPTLFPRSDKVLGIPTASELAALPRLHSWESIKARLAAQLPPERHSVIEARYASWRAEQIALYGSLEEWLFAVRLPWAQPALPADPLEFQEGDVVNPASFAILEADWPVSLPEGVQHCIIWMHKIIFDPLKSFHDPAMSADITQNGYQGITGSDADWHTPTSNSVDHLVRALWPTAEFECAWYVNPPRLQSVRGLSHVHVLARTKEVAA